MPQSPPQPDDPRHYLASLSDDDLRQALKRRASARLAAETRWARTPSSKDRKAATSKAFKASWEARERRWREEATSEANHELSEAELVDAVERKRHLFAIENQRKSAAARKRNAARRRAEAEQRANAAGHTKRQAVDREGAA